MAIKTRVFEHLLEQKGFQKKSGDHNFYYFYLDGIRTNIRTKTSHGSSGRSAREITPYLENKIRNQMHLTKEQYQLFIDCPLKEKDLAELYVNELKIIDSKIADEIE
ncbi:hypothetical protein MmiAt1_09420 [Methanimicrococcus sp. At1]|uniref:Type II toxin-antitoxin system HicA family toxin n=1 Tax=Methanimicrococcus hacksteinii TaxID=3028293 RepID=A0ABU3VPM9_9EURY|nr:hypothetical protein [Methanimicrococcus sp. At1]MDV0445367.1 hypothetical protein [Methanimicrococcus sp. At1]